MTRIEFHFNVEDLLVHACRLARKATRQGVPCVFTGPETRLQALDVQLWTFSALEFLPHGWVGLTSGPVLITLAADPVRALQPGALLVNTGDAVPEGFADWDRLIEIVSTEPMARSAARDRWRHYTRLGYGIGQHDLARETA